MGQECSGNEDGDEMASISAPDKLWMRAAGQPSPPQWDAMHSTLQLWFGPLKCGTLPHLEEEERLSDHYKWWNVLVSLNWDSKDPHTHTENSAVIKALVVHEKPLDFQQLLGYDAIKALGGVLITRTGMIKFCLEAPLCAALKFDQPDFIIEFDQ